MIRLDELNYAEHMNKNGFDRMCSIYELTIYAKWLKYLGETDEYIEKDLIKFAKEHDENFNYQIHYYKIDNALKNMSEYSLRLPITTIVTKNEWDSICRVSDERFRRVLFIMLVVAKFLKNNDTWIGEKERNYLQDLYGLFCVSDTDIYKLAHVSFNPKTDRDKMFREFHKLGLAKFMARKSSYRYVTFVDDDSEPFIEINDYKHLIWYYDRQTGVDNIFECSLCGGLFKKRTNNQIYCSDNCLKTSKKNWKRKYDKSRKQNNNII